MCCCAGMSDAMGSSTVSTGKYYWHIQSNRRLFRLDVRVGLLGRKSLSRKSSFSTVYCKKPGLVSTRKGPFSTDGSGRTRIVLVHMQNNKSDTQHFQNPTRSLAEISVNIPSVPIPPPPSLPPPDVLTKYSNDSFKNLRSN